jgi:hypothetical protein
LLTDIRSTLHKIVDLLTLQFKGEFTLMTEIEKALEDLKTEVTAETDQAAAQNLLLDGIIGTVASGVSEIKALAQQLLIVSNDPQMVRDLAAQLKTAAQAHADKLAALQAASGELASTVTANTTAGTGDSGTPTGSDQGTATPGTSTGGQPDVQTTETPTQTPQTPATSPTVGDAGGDAGSTADGTSPASSSTFIDDGTPL